MLEMEDLDITKPRNAVNSVSASLVTYTTIGDTGLNVLPECSCVHGCFGAAARWTTVRSRGMSTALLLFFHIHGLVCSLGDHAKEHTTGCPDALLLLHKISYACTVSSSHGDTMYHVCKRESIVNGNNR